MRAALVAVALTCACAGRYADVSGAAQVIPATAGLPEIPRRCLVANHVHTIVSDRYSHAPGPINSAYAYSPKGLRAAIAEFRAAGVDAIVLTDHNAIDAIFDPQIQGAGLTILGGMEWTTRRGHALLIGAAASRPADAILPPPWREAIGPADFRAMVATTHTRGGLVIIAHPRVPFRTWPDDTFGADGVEVWGLDNPLMRNPAALRWWHERLADGERLVAIAGTDLHPGAGIRRHHHPLNWVYAPGCDAAALLAAIRAGHVAPVRGRDAPTLLLGAETGGALDFADVREGDITSPGTVDLQVRVVAGRGARLRVLARAGLLLEHTIPTGDHGLRLRLSLRTGDFVRAELRAGGRLVALTNPLYVR